MVSDGIVMELGLTEAVEIVCAMTSQMREENLMSEREWDAMALVIKTAIATAPNATRAETPAESMQAMLSRLNRETHSDMDAPATQPQES